MNTYQLHRIPVAYYPIGSPLLTPQPVSATSVIETVNRLEQWFERQSFPPAAGYDVGYIFSASSALWGSVSYPLQILQALQKVGSPKLFPSDDGTAIRQGTMEEVIRYQIEFYFGDKNYFKDSFLQSFKNERNPDGFVPIAEILRFAKMKRISSAQPNVDMVQLVATLLADSYVVAVHSDRAHLKRLSVEQALVKKVEHFFRATNFPTDSFVPINTITTLPSLVGYNAEFVERVLQHATSNVFEVSSDNYALRKKPTYRGALTASAADRPAGPASPPSYGSHVAGSAAAAEYTVEPLSVQVTQYIEYLFGDVNYPRDDHLQGLAAQDADGFVMLRDIMRFPRMRRLDVPDHVVEEWLRNSEVVVWSTDGRRGLKRRKPLPELRRMVCARGVSEHAPPDGFDTAFTVMSYNILADCLTSKQQFPYTSAATRNWQKRKRDILKELLFYEPDFICLQEVQAVATNADGAITLDITDENNHLAYFVANLRGYDHIYKRKTRYKGTQVEGPDIGNAIFYNKEKFTAHSWHTVEFERVLWKECKKDEHGRAVLAFNHPQVAVFGNFNHLTSGKNVVLATTHICSDFQLPYIQMRQVRACLNELQKFNKQKAPVILAGDFNSQPGSPVYQFLSTGHGPFQPLQSPSGAPIPPTLEFHHEAGLASAYAKILGSEPKCTNLTHEFEGTLDYIWYSKKALRPVAVLDIPAFACLKEEIGLPSKKFPSDHLPLLCKFKFRIPRRNKK